MQENGKEYKRVNYFKGQFISENDFIAEQSYHVEKRRLHNRLFHSPGVVLNYAGELKVTSRNKNDFSLEVAPGYCIDGQGNDIFLWQTQVLTLDLSKFKLPQSAYIVIKYFDDPTDFIVNKANPQYKGHQRICERAKLEIAPSEPEIDLGVELARVQLIEGLEDIKNAKDPFRPQPGELDMRFVPVAGIIGSFVKPDLLNRLASIYEDLRSTFGGLARQYKLPTAREINLATMIADTLTMSQRMDYHTFFRMFVFLVDLQKECALEMEDRPELMKHKEFILYKDNLQALLNLTSQTDIALEDLNNVVIYQTKALVSLKKLLAPAAVRERKVVGEEKLEGEEMTLEEIKIRSKDFPKDIIIDNKQFTLVDTIDILNDQSEKDHEFKLAGVKDEWRTNQEFSYPDGAKVQDRGRAHLDGYAEYKIKGLTPQRDVLLIRRIDYIYGEIKTEMFVDGTRVGTWEITGNDRKNRWRNWPYLIPGGFFNKEAALVKQQAVAADRDVNMFGYWIYQAK